LSPTSQEGLKQAEGCGARPQQGGRLVLALEEILSEQGHCQERVPARTATRLNASAKAWTPGEALVQAPPPGALPDFLCQVRSVIRAAAFVLAGAESVLSIDACEGDNGGWTVVAHLLPEDCVRHRERLLKLAKEALLQASAASQNVYVLGHRWRPFVATPFGFGARLAAVKEPAKACWGLLNKGVCAAGGHCRWEHPHFQANVSVMVRPREQ